MRFSNKIDFKIVILVFGICVKEAVYCSSGSEPYLDTAANDYAVSPAQAIALQRLIDYLGVANAPESWKDSRPEKRDGMWFGPRLGRKKRSLDDSLSAINLPSGEVLSKDDFPEILDMLQDAPWTVVALTGGRRYTMNFTPRLGRQLGEVSREAGSAGSVAEGLADQRAPPFAPRLGRRLIPFSPRLGRELLSNVQASLQPRYSRSTKTKPH